MRKSLIISLALGMIFLSGCVQEPPEKEVIVGDQIIQKARGDRSAIASSDVERLSSAVRSFVKDPDLNLDFLDSRWNPYLDEPRGRTEGQVVNLVDYNGWLYMVALDTKKVIQIGPGPESDPDSFVDSTESYSQEQLQEQAFDWLRQRNIDLELLSENLEFDVTTKDAEGYFFRWNNPEAMEENGDMRFLQIGLRGDGSLLSYTNTLYRFFNGETDEEKTEERKSLAFNYTTDGEHVYRGDTLIPELDPVTFEVVKDRVGGDCGYFVKDKDSLFFEDDGVALKEIEDRDIQPLDIAEGKNIRYYKGEKSMYILGPNWGGCIVGFSKIEGIDPNTFQYLDGFYAKDRNHIYYLTSVLEGADLDTFEVLPDGRYAKDENKVYERGREMGAKFSAVTDYLMALFQPVGEGDELALSAGGHVWWIDEDGYSFYIPVDGHLVLSRVYDYGKEERPVAEVCFKEELEIAKEFFTDWGFRLNERNSSDSFEDDTFYDYVQAYEKGDELCTITVSPDVSGLVVACTNDLARAKKEQMPFLEALGLKDQDKVAILRAQNGDFFEVSTHWRRTGLTVILKKEEDSYRVLFTGQEAPLCRLIANEGIPSEVLKGIGDGDCYTDSGERIEAD